MTAESFTTADAHYMQRAIKLARQGEGSVEPNPMVGCVIVQGDDVVGEGWHQAFGGPHAEMHALEQAGDRAKDATAYVTLEPCSHTGKTPPCAEALIAAGLGRVVIGQQDPNPKVAGGGVAALQEAGIDVQSGLLSEETAELIAPFRMLMECGRPWVIAKWAMTLDGKLAAIGGDSQWISSSESREKVHALRGRVDAVIIGGGTARRDNPMLTARPPGPRTATRIVVSGSANLALDSKLVTSASEAPVMCAASDYASPDYCRELIDRGVEVIGCGKGPLVDVARMLTQLGERDMTNVLLEGGGGLLGSFFDQDLIDEVHVFVGPKLVGGERAPSPIGGEGLDSMSLARRLSEYRIEEIGGDVYLHGRVNREPSALAAGPAKQ